MKKINIKGPIVSNDTAWLYNYFGWDASSPNTLRKGLEEAAGEDVVLEINSPGGVCIYGYEMYTALMEYEGKITAHVISAMSAATLLVCAADEALISDTGIFMIHNVQSRADGDYRDMQMEADALREFNAGIINAYVRKTQKSREEIQALMDNDSYMSPKTAIEHGFIDGYMFGDPNMEEHVAADDLAAKIVAADMPIIPEDKAKEVIQAIKLSSTEVQNIGDTAVSDKSNEGGKTDMETLAEFLDANPEAKQEVDAMNAAARAEGIKEERERLQSLDAIAATVTADALHSAKYGENPVDGPTLAYQAMVNGDKLAAAYMAAAKEDSEISGVNDVGIGTPDAGEDQTDEADTMAAYVNNRS
ncbi:MAG: Clp protease ClpP [Candidatus Gastranaerophilales bacterium]|nr:Clp protease ClpP [Candidatus Gastranaerophilales bacterium]